uniref:AVL9 homolog (S. cerevisiase) n=1 Tax=Neogobius melanostomus TaxID=47308 RepID=A0A8C6SLE9_9GOBI
PSRALRSGDEAEEGPVLHIVVVGFHHKKGCQVEFSYPPLVPDWRYLPFLALPDGAHNYQEDTVFFHLPPLSAEQKCVYGVSCYRQIEAKTLKVRQADVTRETVQKSVCVLSRVPLYGLLQAKLQLITHAYFEEKDFSQISILKELYEHMNGSLRGSSVEGSQVYLGQTLTHLYYETLKPLKGLYRVMFYVSPVNRLVGAPNAAVSPGAVGLVEHGLVDSSHYRPQSSVSEELSLTSESGSGADEFVSVSVTDLHIYKNSFVPRAVKAANSLKTFHSIKPILFKCSSDSNFLKPPSRTSPDSESDWETLDPGVLDEIRDHAETPEVFESPSGTPITSQPLSGAGGITPGLVSGLEEDQYGLRSPSSPRVTCVCRTWLCSSTTCSPTSPSGASSPGQPTSCSDSSGTSATPS